MQFRHVLCAVLVTAIWGGNYVASKTALTLFPPFYYTALRYAVVACVLVPLVPRPPRPAMGQLVALSAVLCVGHLGLILVSLSEGLNIPGSAIMLQMGVPISCLLGVIFFKDRIGWWRMSGLILSFLGVIIVAGNPNVLEHPHAYFIALASAACWAVSNIQIKKLGNISVFQLLAWQSVFAVPMLLLIAFVLEEPSLTPIYEATWPVWLSFCYTAFGSTMIAYGLWSWLMRRFEVSRVAPYSLLAPIFAIAFGQLFYADQLTWELLVGGAITIAGVGIITVRRPRMRQYNENV